MSEQADFFEDHLAALRRLLKQSVDRIGLGVVSAQTGLDPSTISNQLAYRDARKRPCADIVLVCLALDPQFRRDIAKLFGESIVDGEPEYITPEQALRDVAVHAKAGDFGNEGRRIALEIFRRVKKS